MKELFRDAYCRDFQAVVTACRKTEKGYAVELDQTAFYPEGGGQPGDTGTLNEIAVTDVRRNGSAILHYTDRPLEAGTQVQGSVDWARRYQHMQEHSGEHIVSGLVHARFGYDNVGFHMSDVVTLDFNGPLTWQQCMDIEQEANRVIDEGIEVRILYPASEPTVPYRSKKEIDQDLRLVEIEGVDRCACCGTHVQNTHEIGVIKLLLVTKHKQGVRLELLAGAKARAHYRHLHWQNKDISVSLKARPDQTARAVHALMEKGQKKEKELAELYHRYYQSRIQTMPTEEWQIQWEAGWPPFRLKQFCEEIFQAKKGDVCVVLSDGYYVMMSDRIDLRPIAKECNEKLQGKGGGQSGMVQGHWQADRQQIEQVLPEVLRAHA